MLFVIGINIVLNKIVKPLIIVIILKNCYVIVVPDAIILLLRKSLI